MMLVGLRSRKGRIRTPIILPSCSVNHIRGKEKKKSHKRGRNSCPSCYSSETQERKGINIYPQPDASKKRENSNIPVVTATHHSPTLKGEGLGAQNH